MKIFGNIYTFYLRSILGLLVLATLSSSCEKEELPVAPATIKGHTATMGEDYRTLSYFNIIENKFVQSADRMTFDLNFMSDPEEHYIYLNSCNTMYLKNMGLTPFESVLDTAGGSSWLYDDPSGDSKKTAFGKWYAQDGTSKNEIFVVNRGTDDLGKFRGYVKIQILSVNSTSYKIRLADLDGSNDRTIEVAKNQNKLTVQLSFDDDQLKDIEPNKTNWHLLFTQYLDEDVTTEGDTLPYSVRGVLINSAYCEAVKIVDIDFNDIHLDMMPQFEFSNDQNTIGYNWKYFSFETEYYTVISDYTYVIKTYLGGYYKLRFLGFYNDDGIKGHPRFEIIGL